MHSNDLSFHFLGNEISFHENQSDIDKYKSSIVTGIQEFSHDGRTMGFVYKLKQNSLWT